MGEQAPDPRRCTPARPYCRVVPAGGDGTPHDPAGTPRNRRREHGPVQHTGVELGSLTPRWVDAGGNFASTNGAGQCSGVRAPSREDGREFPRRRAGLSGRLSRPPRTGGRRPGGMRRAPREDLRRKWPCRDLVGTVGAGIGNLDLGRGAIPGSGPAGRGSSAACRGPTRVRRPGSRS